MDICWLSGQLLSSEGRLCPIKLVILKSKHKFIRMGNSFPALVGNLWMDVFHHSFMCNNTQILAPNTLCYSNGNFDYKPVSIHYKMFWKFQVFWDTSPVFGFSCRGFLNQPLSAFTQKPWIIRSTAERTSNLAH